MNTPREAHPPEVVGRAQRSADSVLSLFDDADWQMSFGERAALEGILSYLQPTLAIEIGTAEGGSLARLALHGDEVHSFDLVEPKPAAAALDNVRFHTGDSHALLPELLEQLAADGRNVDFALVDGDHSADGVRRDMTDLLDSPAVGSSVIVMHDTMNEEVRTGLEQVRYDSYPKVSYVELDLVAGYLFRDDRFFNELWGGLGLVTTDSRHQALDSGPGSPDRYHEPHDLVLRAREAMAAERRDGEGTEQLRKEVEHLALCLTQIQASASWRLTRPLRTGKRLATRVRR